MTETLGTSSLHTSPTLRTLSEHHCPVDAYLDPLLISSAATPRPDPYLTSAPLPTPPLNLNPDPLILGTTACLQIQRSLEIAYTHSHFSTDVCSSPDDSMSLSHHSRIRSHRPTRQRDERNTTHETPSALVEPSLPVACASLLSLKSAYGNHSQAAVNGSRRNTGPELCSKLADTTHPSSSPVSVFSPQAGGKRRSGSRFWETVMSATASAPDVRSVEDGPSRSATPPSQHSVSGTDSGGISPFAPRSSKAAWSARSPDSTPCSASSRALSREDDECKMNIPCVVCGVRFRKPGHLNMHWRSVHATSSDAVYPGKMHTTALQRAGHRVMAPVPPVVKADGRVAKSVNGRAYGCPQCEARFRRGSDRNRHMRMVHAKIRPFECKQCGNHFGRKSFLEAHVLTVHEKQRPYRCDCGAAFGQRSSLTRHIRKIHGKEP